MTGKFQIGDSVCCIRIYCNQSVRNVKGFITKRLKDEVSFTRDGSPVPLYLVSSCYFGAIAEFRLSQTRLVLFEKTKASLI